MAGRFDGSTIHPAFAGFEPLRSEMLAMMRCRPGTAGWTALANRVARDNGVCTATGMPLRFVPTDALCVTSPDGVPRSSAALDYERRIHDTGVVACRTDARGETHDLHNALVWLHWPRTKAEINRQHLLASQNERLPGGQPRRSRWRDGLTLLDESGVVWFERVITGNGPADVEPVLRWAHSLMKRDWHSLLVAERDALREALKPDPTRVDLMVRIVGHGLLEKWQTPYKALTGQALVIALPASRTNETSPGTSGAVNEPDACVAHALSRAWLRHDGHCVDSGSILALSDGRIALGPLPLSGLPGWYEGNDAPDFLNDPTVFRPRAAVQT